MKHKIGYCPDCRKRRTYEEHKGMQCCSVCGLVVGKTERADG